MKTGLPLNPYPSEIQQKTLQKQLSKSCFWDEVEQVLWIDCRKVLPEFGVLSVPSWDALTMSSAAVPSYPSNLKILDWSNYSQISYWRKQIPQWVQDSCALFPTHQLSLLHYAGKYPQVLELLDHSPMLAWRLTTCGLTEPDIVALLSGKRQAMVGKVGWPEKVETVKFLRNLRLRLVNNEIAEQIEVCLMDEQRLTALQELPRINSMALSLAARFPELIGCKLHHALAQLPCRPMQCQSMVALLEDAYRLSEALNLRQSEIDKIGRCRYLIEVTEIYQAWLKQGLLSLNLLNLQVLETQINVESFKSALSFELASEPNRIVNLQDWLLLSQLQQHAWWIDFDSKKRSQVESTLECKLESTDVSLVAWCDEDGVWAALIAEELAEESIDIMHVRGLDNSLAGPKQWSQLHLWQASL